MVLNTVIRYWRAFLAVAKAQFYSHTLFLPRPLRPVQRYRVSLQFVFTASFAATFSPCSHAAKPPAAVSTFPSTLCCSQLARARSNYIYWPFLLQAAHNCTGLLLLPLFGYGASVSNVTPSGECIHSKVLTIAFNSYFESLFSFTALLIGIFEQHVYISISHFEI